MWCCPVSTKSEELSLNSYINGKMGGGGGGGGRNWITTLDVVLYSLETIAFLSQQMVKRPPQLSPDFSISIFVRVDMGLEVN